MFLRLGTWQLSDLFYNTLGGAIGGLIYYIGYNISVTNGKSTDITKVKNSPIKLYNGDPFDEITINRNEPNKEVSVQNMINVFRNDTIYSELYTRCEVCSLLKNRCMKFNILLNDEKELINQIKNS